VRWAAIAWLAVVLAAGCAGDEEDPAAAIPEGELTLERLRPDGQFCDYGEAANLVVRDGRTWGDVWRRVVASASPRPAAPTVDFHRKMVLASFLGPKEGGGHAVSIARVEREGDRLVVTLAVRTPRSRIPPDRTSPFSVVAVPRADLEVEWRTVDAATGKPQNR
jgi:hypothetical protein